MTSLVQPAAVVALANVRLRDASEALSRKRDATTVNVLVRNDLVGVVRSHFGDTEHRVLALVDRAGGMIRGSEPVDLPVTSPLFPGPSKFAVLGSAGFTVTAYADMFYAGGDWRTALLRRGTPDPERSLVSVPSTSFALAASAALLAGARRDTARQARAAMRAEAMALGLLGAVAHGVVFSPVQRGERERLTSRRWNRDEPGPMLAAADAAVLARLIGGDDPGAHWRRWWPEPDDARPLWGDLFTALDGVYRVDRADRARGWPAFEAWLREHPSPPLTAERLATGYEHLLADVAPWGMGTWFLVLTPFLLSPTASILLALTLPHGKRFLGPADPLTDRSFTELFSLASSLSSVPPFIASMIAWGTVPERTDAFVEALLIFLVRAGLFAGWLTTIGTEAEDPQPAARTLIAGGMLVPDLYALVRALIAKGGTKPGSAVVFGMQTIPGVLGLTTLLQAALIKGVVGLTKQAGGSDTVASAMAGVTLGVTALGGWLGVGLPLAHSLARGGGWMSWFRTTPALSFHGALAAGSAREPSGPAALFDDSTLWHDPANAAPTLADLRYPTGGRALVKVWRTSAAPALEISQDGHFVRIRNQANVTVVPIGPGQRTVADIVEALAAVAGVQARAVEDSDRYDLPWPSMLADPAVDRDPGLPESAPERAAFTPLPASEADAVVIRHAPDAELTTRFGLTGQSGSRFDSARLVPQATLGDVEDTALGAAADLTVVLALGAAARLPDTPSAGVAPPPAVARVFRNWNLDDRRVNEWRMLIAGGATPEDAPPAVNRVEGERVAHALGWVGLWRAWLRVASDTTQDASSPVVAPYAPTARAADGSAFRPTNAQLNAGVRYLLEL